MGLQHREYNVIWTLARKTVSVTRMAVMLGLGLVLGGRHISQDAVWTLRFPTGTITPANRWIPEKALKRSLTDPP